MKQRPVPILMYHQVTPAPTAAFGRYTVTPRQFARQMQWLAWAEYSAITLDQLYAARLGQAPLPRRPVVITFDDGFQECVQYAVPVLRAQGFTATFFLVAGLMGAQSEWLRPEIGLTFPLIDWVAARQLEGEGLHCGVHTLSHVRLTAVTATQCRTELGQARQVLEEQLGHSVVHLSYPYGSYNAETRAIAAEVGFQTACSTRHGLSTPADDPLALHRVSLYGSDSLLAFIWRVHTGSGLREFLQRRSKA